MVAYTTTYNLAKPTVGDDEDLWGGYLNGNFDTLESLLKGTTSLTSLSLTGDITFGDNDKAIFGAGSDLQLYHDSVTHNSYIAETGVGDLVLQGANIRLQNTSGNYYVRAYNGGALNLYYDNALKLATENGGVSITGNITVSGTVDGRDVAADGTKLDGIESGATADQTKADIDALGIAASTAATLATARNIALTGAVTGNVNFDGSGNVSIATTATSDPTLTLSGDASGSATFTNLGNATLSVTVADDSHNHVISNVDGLQTALDGKLSTSGKAADSNLLDGLDSSAFLRSNANDTMSGNLTINASGGTGLVVEGVADQFGALFSKDLDSPDEPAVVLIVSDADTPNDDLALEIRGNGTGSSVDKTTTMSSADTTFAVFGDGTTTIGYNSLGVNYTAPNSAKLAVNGAIDASDLYIDGSIYHDGDTNTRILFTNDEITMQTGGSSEITVTPTGVRLGDTGNGYFQPVSGNYGSIQIDGGAHSGWEGYSIGGHSVFMSNGSTTGIYNDTNNHWILEGIHNGATKLCYAGSEKLDTLSNGVSINGNLYTDGSNAEDYDALSGTSPTCNVDNAGAFSLTMTGNTTFTFSGADSGWIMGFVLQLTGNGSTVTWPASVKWAGGTAPDAPASGETDILVFHTRDGGTNWYGVLASDAAA